jgi:hypothetical protein
VLASALLHASWNLLAKRARGGTGFLYLFSLLTVAVYGPVALGYVLVAPTREVSILIGALLGTRLLAEGEGSRGC